VPSSMLAKKDAVSPAGQGANGLGPTVETSTNPNVTGYIELGKKEGANIATGGTQVGSVIGIPLKSSLTESECRGLCREESCI